MVATESLLVTSQPAVASVPPAAAMRCAVSTRRSASRSVPKTCAPSSAKRTAMARPLPQPGPTEPAPV